MITTRVSIALLGAALALAVLVGCVTPSRPSAGEITPVPTYRPTLSWENRARRPYPVIVPTVARTTSAELPRYTLSLPDNSGYKLFGDGNLPAWAHTITEVVDFDNSWLLGYIAEYQAPDAPPSLKRDRLLTICHYYAIYGVQGVYMTVTQWVNDHGGCPSSETTNETPFSTVDASNEELFDLVKWYGYLTEDNPRRSDYLAEICKRIQQMKREDIDPYILNFVGDKRCQS